MRRGRVQDVFVGGLATDYCVKQTALDALRQGFAVYVLRDACRGVEVRAGDSRRALAELQEKRARLITLRTLKTE
jgi:nicotinamidase/pyrazinamidase